MEQKIIFREMLTEILELADERGNCLTTQEIDEFFANTHLSREQMELVYEYLIGRKVQVKGYESKGEHVPGGREDQEKELKDSKKRQAEAALSREGDGGAAAGESFPKPSESGEDDENPSALELYLKELEGMGEAGTEEELELFHLAADGDGAAKSRLIELYLPLVCRLAGDYQGEEFLVEDLIQEGNVGLLLAVDQVERQESLAAYQARLMNAVNQYMEDVIREQKDLRDLGEGIVSRVNHLSQAIHNLEEELEHRVSVEELSAYLEMPAEEIRDILRMAGDEIEVEGYGNQ